MDQVLKMKLQSSAMKRVMIQMILLVLPIVVKIGEAAPVVDSRVGISGKFESVRFREGYSVIWGKPNVKELNEDKNTIQLVLDRQSGSGFKSKEKYHHGFFSVSIKLPSNYSAGVVTAFYTSNSEVFPYTHDEFDFEFLGVIPGMPYILQTNIYGNGSVETGREERFHLWFDPTAEFHQYSLLWNRHHVVFMVDSIPIRELKRKDIVKNGTYPSKPMSVYATIWDGSEWATSGGKYPVDYSKAPFVATFTHFKLQHGQTLLTSSMEPSNEMQVALSKKQILGLEWVRRKFMIYSYCDDKRRYPHPLPECAAVSKHRKTFRSHSRRI